MAMRVGISQQGSSREKMWAGQHPAVLGFIKPDVDEFQGKSRDVFVWRWDHTTEVDAEGQPLVIWCRTNDKFGYQLASLTKLMRQIFGPELTEQEAEQIDLELLIGQIQGYVLVQDDTNQKGEPIVKFTGYVHPKGQPYPNPADFFANEGTGDPDFVETAPRPPSQRVAAPPAPQRAAAPPQRAAAPSQRPAPTAPAPRQGNHIPGVANPRAPQTAPSMTPRRQAPPATDYDDLEDPFAE